MIRTFAALCAAVCLVVSAASPVRSAGAALTYPPAPRGTVTDSYFGTVVADPYRWLESIDSPETTAWVQAEGDLTRSYLDAIPERARVRSAYEKLINYPRLTVPFHAGSHWFYSRNRGLQNQSVLYVRQGEDGPSRVLLDPNKLSSDGTVAVAGTSVTTDGHLIAYATESSGSDWETWRVRDVATGRDLPDVIAWSKFGGATWVGDTGFYYSAYDRPANGVLLSALGVQKLYFHRLRTPQSADRLVYASTQHPDQFVGADTTEDERYVFLETTKGDGNSLAWRRRGESDRAFRPMFALDPNVHYNVVGDDGDRLYIETNRDAPRSRLAWVDVRDPAHVLHDIVPQAADKLRHVSLLANRFYLSYLHDAHSLVRIAALDGKPAGAIRLPGVGTGGLPTGLRRDRVAYYAFTSYTYPATIYRYDTSTGTSRVAVRPPIAFDPSPYVTEQLFATSKDGTRVPVFVTHRTTMPLDGSTPTILYGYGGFDIDETPFFSASVALWLEMGGAYADVVLRGGGEYGEAWHDAGRLGNKQHVFDDFFAAAQMLIDRKITSTPKLAASGASNGGLLVGAAITQRPDLFGAAIPEVGVLDMLRYQKFTVGKAWIPEYGASDQSPEAFAWLRAYSPDQNVHDGTAYPPTLVMTSDHDDRVFPAHSFKFAAELQHAQRGDAPILLRVQTKAGHGGGRPISKILDDVADRYAFLVKNLNFTPALP